MVIPIMFLDSEWKIETFGGNISAGLLKLHAKNIMKNLLRRRNFGEKFVL